jgi:hypothetical protein
MLTKRKAKSGVWGIVITIVVFAVFAGFVFAMLANADATSQEEEIRVVREAIVRAAVSCYAFEGFYPDSLDYLTEHYSLVIDRERFVVYYSKVADNLVPVIIVSVRGGGG